MSDFYRNQPDVNDLYDAKNLPGNGEEWDSSFFNPQDEGYRQQGYADTNDNVQPEQPDDPYSAWRKPAGTQNGSFLLDDPVPFGAALQQGGVPLFGAEKVDDVFAAFSPDAPTRVATPIQMVNKRTTVMGDDGGLFMRPSAPEQTGERLNSSAALPEAPSTKPDAHQTFNPEVEDKKQGEEPVQRRRSRMSRRTQEEAASAAVPEAGFDPFNAGDSELPQSLPQPAPDANGDFRRSAVPGGRYTGARTAVPSLPAEGESAADRAMPRRTELMKNENQEDARQPEQGFYQQGGAPKRRSPVQPMNGNRAAPSQNNGKPNGMAGRSMPQQGAPVNRPMAQQDGAANRPLPQQGAPVNRPVAQQDGAANRPVPRQGAPVNRPMPQQGAPGNRPMTQQGGPNGRPVTQHEMPGNRPVARQSGAARRPAASPQELPTQWQANQGMQQGGEEGYARKQISAQEQGQFAYRAQQNRPQHDQAGRNSHASVNRKPYDFEHEEDEAPRRKSSLLVPIVIVLLVIGGLLAAICLPDWQGMGGGIGGALSPVKSTVISAFASVKNLIAPEQEPIKSFAISTSDTIAPASVRLTVQTSKGIAGIVVKDDDGNTVYSRNYDSQLTLSGEAIENSNALIWTPTCKLEKGYSGGFTVYAQKADGTESEGMRAENTVNIAPPKPVLPPVQSFTSNVEEAAVPVMVAFTVVTSVDVTAVRVVDQYNSPIVGMSESDGEGENGAMAESGDTRTWTLNTEIAMPYAGNYAVQYQTTEGNLNYIDSGYTVACAFTQAEEKTADKTTDDGATDDAADEGEDGALADDEAAEPLSGDSPENAKAAVGGLTATTTAEPSAASTAAPTAQPTLAPDSTPLPVLNVEAGEAAKPAGDDIKLKPTLYSGGKTVESYSRTNAISMLSPFTSYANGNDYALWKQAGVLTFRSGPMRQNAAYGTVEVTNGKLTQVWSQPVGSMKLSSDVLYGVNAPGQPVIVKWPSEVRQRMALKPEAKDVTALKEVIVAGQDGKIYFYNLLDGAATRDPLDLGAPSAGGLSVATNGTPILGVGQSHSKLRGKTVKSGYHVINLLKNEKTMLVQTDGNEKNSNYSGVLGSALFDSKTGAMIFGSQGGVLYTVELGKQKDVYDHMAGTLSLSSATQAYKSTARQQDKKDTNIDSSIAMYNNYVYYGDQSGIMQCVNVNSMTPVWVVRMGDNVDATPALDMEDESTVALYAGNTILKQGRSGICTIKRINALTGDVDWSYDVPDVKGQSDYEVGLEASPVVGQKSISDLVIFTVANGANGSRVMAMNKKSGAVVWQTDLTVETVSSPVAVYNENGDAWIVQALRDGQINLLSGKTGEVLDTLALNTEIKASPAVYGNLLVIGSTGKTDSNVYCIKID